MKTLLLINGPNLNMLGIREPDIYGSQTLPEIEELFILKADDVNIRVIPYQSNHEGAIIDFIQAEYKKASGIVINPGALTHYGYSLRDCLAGANLPVVEVHLSDIQNREEWRKKSVLSEIRTGVISGLGPEGYLKALDYFKDE